MSPPDIPEPRAAADGEVRIRRGRVASVDLYEIKDSELDLLEHGSPAELYLNFAIFLISLAFASITTLATATFTMPQIATLYLVVSVVGVLGGIFLLILWLRTRVSVARVAGQIRSRIPPDKAPASSPTDLPSG